MVNGKEDHLNSTWNISILGITQSTASQQLSRRVYPRVRDYWNPRWHPSPQWIGLQKKYLDSPLKIFVVPQMDSVPAVARGGGDQHRVRGVQLPCGHLGAVQLLAVRPLRRLPGVPQAGVQRGRYRGHPHGQVCTLYILLLHGHIEYPLVHIHSSKFEPFIKCSNLISKESILLFFHVPPHQSVNIMQKLLRKFFWKNIQININSS